MCYMCVHVHKYTYIFIGIPTIDIRPRMEKLHSGRPRTGRFPKNWLRVLVDSESISTQITEYKFISRLWARTELHHKKCLNHCTYSSIIALVRRV